MKRSYCIAAVFAALWAVAGDAHAADGEQVSRRQSGDLKEADRLFNEGRTLMDKGQLAEACPKLERSFQLAPRLGTMLNLGGCFERSGRLARAVSIYERAATMAREAGRHDREKVARELAAAIEPRVAKLLLVIGDTSQGLVIEVDGESVSTQSGIVPIDPGERKVNARAPGKRPWAQTITASAGSTVRVSVPTLEELPPEAPPQAAQAPVFASPPPPSGSNVRTIGIVSGLGVTVVGAALGTFFGLQAKSKHDESSSHCDARGCDPQGDALTKDALAAGNVATGAFIAAGVGLVATGVFVFFVHSPRTRVAVAPARGGSTFNLVTRF